jgi:GR25 family glycosyltransferase involved in LPS biosynthesis
MEHERKSNLFQVYCINLKERPDRWERFIQQPGVQRIQQNFSFERFEGINGKLLDIKNDSRVSLRTKRNILYQKRRDHEDLDTPGGVGCYLSHYSCWKKFLETDKEKLLVLEDDAEIPPQFLEQLMTAMEDLNQEDIKRPDIWMLAKPFGPTLTKALELGSPTYSKNWSYDVMAPLTGYILTRQGAKVLCENAFPIDGHVDHFMRRCTQMGMVVLAAHKNIQLKQVRLKKGDSDIQQKPSCEVCNLPDAPTNKGYLIISNQGVASAVVATFCVATLLLLKTYFKK